MDRPKRYLTRSQTRQRYGGCSDMWIYRRLKDDPRFPKPLKIAGRDFFDEAALDAYDVEVMRETETADV